MSKFGILLILILVTVSGISNSALAKKPKRHPAELDLMMRAEWDGDLNHYIKEIKAQKKLEELARAEQHELRHQEEIAAEKNRIEFGKQRTQKDREARIQAMHVAYAEMLRYRKEQDDRRKQYALEKAAARMKKKETKVARITNFKAVRLALIQFENEQNKTRRPAMLKMPKPDTTALKAGGGSDVGNAFPPPLPAPPFPAPNVPGMDTANLMQPIPSPGFSEAPPLPPPTQDQTASAAPTFAPTGAETGRAFGGAGSAR